MFETLALAAILQATPNPIEGGYLTARSAVVVNAIDSAAAPPKKYRKWAECVLKRETGAVLRNRNSREDARNPSSSASGRWQFLAAWQNGLPYMVKDRLVDHGMPEDRAREIRKSLANKPIYKWDGTWQDIGAFEVMERGGAFHWRGHTCGLP